MIATTVPQLLQLLHNKNPNVRTTGVNIIGKLSENGMFRAILDICYLYTFEAGLHAAIENIIPQILQLLGRNHDQRIRDAGGKAMVIMAKHCELQVTPVGFLNLTY